MQIIKARGSQAVEAINYMDEFRTFGALSATRAKLADLGQLPPEWAELYRSQQVAYTVLSYRTPIAWCVYDDRDGGFVAYIPDVRYSQTTSQHQGQAKRGLDDGYRKVCRTLSDCDAPKPEERPRVSPQSGEGALYSPEYLRSKTPAGRS